MKQKKSLKKMLSLTVSAVMLLSVLSIGAMAADSIPTSNAYTIDSDSKTVYVLQNTFVGDFLRRINSHDSVKKVVDADNNIVTSGWVTENQSLMIGSTKYSIQFVAPLFDLSEEIKDIPKNTEIFNWTFGGDAKNNEHRIAYAFSNSDTVIKDIFTAAIEGSSSMLGGEDDGYKATVKITVKEDSNGIKYLEFKTNSQSSLNFITKEFKDYSNEKTYGEYIVSELDIKQISTDDVDGTSGFLLMGRRYNGTEGKSMAENYVKDDNGHSDYIIFNRQNYFNMGGSSSEYWTGGGRSIHTTNPTAAYSSASMYNTKQYHVINQDNATSITVDAVYLNGERQSGHGKGAYNGLESFEIPVVEGKTVSEMTNGIIGVGTNGYLDITKTKVYGEESVIELYNYSVYLADNLHDAVNNNSVPTATEKDENGYQIISKASGVPATVKYVMPGTTAQELIDNLAKTTGWPKYCYGRIATKSGDDSTIIADNAIVTGGNYLSLTAGQSGSGTRGYIIYLAAVEDATTTTNGTTLTATRSCDNTVLGTFVFAAYDDQDKLIETQTTTTSVDGVRSVTFNTAASEIASVKSFIFSNMASLRPVTDIITPTAN